MSNYYTTAKAAEYLAERGYTVRSKRDGTNKSPPADTIKHWCIDGKLPGAKKHGRDWSIPKEALDRLIRSTTMQKIILEQFGPVTRFDAAHIVDASGQVGAYIAEPEARRNEDGVQAKDWDEEAFRTALEAEIGAWEPRATGERVWVQYDPGRNTCSEVEVELRG